MNYAPTMSPRMVLAILASSFPFCGRRGNRDNRTQDPYRLPSNLEEKPAAVLLNASGGRIHTLGGWVRFGFFLSALAAMPFT